MYTSNRALRASRRLSLRRISVRLFFYLRPFYRKIILEFLHDAKNCTARRGAWTRRIFIILVRCISGVGIYIYVHAHLCNLFCRYLQSYLALVIRCSLLQSLLLLQCINRTRSLYRALFVIRSIVSFFKLISQNIRHVSSKIFVKSFRHEWNSSFDE